MNTFEIGNSQNGKSQFFFEIFQSVHELTWNFLSFPKILVQMNPGRGSRWEMNTFGIRSQIFQKILGVSYEITGGNPKESIFEFPKYI